MMIRTLGRMTASLLLFLAPAASAIDRGAPPAPRDNVHDTINGVSIADPYRWLENGDDPRVIAWEHAENSRARATLDALPVRAAIAAQLKHLLGGASPSWRNLRAAGGKVFATATVPPREQPMVVVMGPDLDAAHERVVIDPNTMDPTGQTAVDWWVPSPDGSLVAASISRNGSEDGTVHVFRVADGHETGDVEPRAQYPTGGGSLAWAPDGHGFWVTRYPGAERPAADRHFHQGVVFHVLGTPPEQDRMVLGAGLPAVAEITLDNRFDPSLLQIAVADGDGGTFEHFVVGPDGQLRQVTHFADGVVGMVAGPDGALYLVSHQGAPRGKLLRLAPGVTNIKDAAVIVPEGRGVMQSQDQDNGVPIVVTPHALYVPEEMGGPSVVAVFGLDGRAEGTVGLPPDVAVDEVAAVAPDRLAVGTESWTTPKHFVLCDAAGGVVDAAALASTSPATFPDTEVVRAFATSADGTQVPVTIIRKRGTTRDGRNPTLLYGYGGYGISLSPSFTLGGARARLWLDGGGVYAVANIRGGGEWGEDWHANGALTHKQNVFDDFTAAARMLIDTHVTSPDHLAIEGGSNGGLLMGAEITQHPAMFRAVVSLVGIYDMMRVELDPNGAFNVTEFGTVKNPAQFCAMLAYSPYHHVVVGTAYPAIFMATGAHDGRVNPMHSRKMVAALQAATSSGRPVLLAISDKSGHGIGSSLDVRIAQQADDFAFLFDQLGMTLPAAAH